MTWKSPNNDSQRRLQDTRASTSISSHVLGRGGMGISLELVYRAWWVVNEQRGYINESVMLRYVLVYNVC